MDPACDHVQRSLLDDAAPTPATRAHLDVCAACQEYAEVLRRLADPEPGADPPARLDAAILAHARSRSASRPPPRLRCFDWRLAAAALAAAAVLVFVGVRLFLPTSAVVPPPAPEEVVRRPQPAPVNPVPPPKLAAAVVDQFHWDDDPIATELARLEADMVLTTLDDRNADIVGQGF